MVVFTCCCFHFECRRRACESKCSVCDRHTHGWLLNKRNAESMICSFCRHLVDTRDFQMICQSSHAHALLLVPLSSLQLRNGHANHLLKRDDNIASRLEQNDADLAVDNNDRELKNNGNNDALCDSATKYLYSMAAKGLIQGTLDVFSNKRATRFGRKIAEKVDREAFRKNHNKPIEDLSEENLIQLTREFFDIAYESAGLVRRGALIAAGNELFSLAVQHPLLAKQMFSLLSIFSLLFQFSDRNCFDCIGTTGVV